MGQEHPVVLKKPGAYGMTVSLTGHVLPCHGAATGGLCPNCFPLLSLAPQTKPQFDLDISEGIIFQTILEQFMVSGCKQ